MTVSITIAYQVLQKPGASKDQNLHTRRNKGLCRWQRLSPAEIRTSIVRIVNKDSNLKSSCYQYWQDKLTHSQQHMGDFSYHTLSVAE